jgi:hypothetical protein
MKPLFLVPLIVITLTACEDGSRAELRKQLKDPDSAKFEETIVYKNFKCIKYNAKNSYGGYSGATWAILEHQPYGWNVVSIHEDFCSEFTLRDLAEPEKAAEKERVGRRILAAMREHNLIPDDVNEIYRVPSGPCLDLATKVHANARHVIDSDKQSDKDWYQKQYDDGMKLISQGQCKA